MIFALVLFISCSVGAPAKSSDTPPNDKPAKGKGEEKSSDEAKQPVTVEEDGRSSQPPGPLASLGFGLPQAC